MTYMCVILTTLNENNCEIKVEGNHAEALTRIRSRESAHENPLTRIRSRRSAHAEALMGGWVIFVPRKSAHAEALILWNISEFLRNLYFCR